MNEIDFKNNISEIWKNLQTPLAIDKEFFLTKKAVSIDYKDLKFEDNLGKMNIRYSFSACITKAGNPILEEEKSDLPELRRNLEKSKSNFAVNFPMNLTYSEMKEKYKSKFSGEALNGKNSKGKNKKYGKVVDVEFFGSEEDEFDLVIELSSKLKKNSIADQVAPIYLHAKLAYDTIQKTIFIKQFKIDEISKSALEKHEFQPIVSKTTYAKMMSKFTFKVDNLVKKHKKILRKMKEGSVDLTNSIKLLSVNKSLEIDKIISQPDNLFMLFVLKGNTKTETLNINKIEKK